MEQHLTIEISDALAKKIASDLPVPFVVLDRHVPFDKPRMVGEVGIGSPASQLLDHASKASLFGQAKGKLSGPDEDVAASIARSISSIEGHLVEQIHKLRESRKHADENGLVWSGPSEEEIINGMSKGDWDVAAHCAWLKVVLRDRFSIALNSPVTTVNDVQVAVSATGELWLKHWYAECVDHCGPWDIWCCHWHSGHKWSRVGEHTIHNVRILSDAKLTFRAKQNGVVARPRFTKLRLDYDILREIPLEGVANWILDEQNQEIAVLSAEDLHVEVGGTGIKYGPANIEIPTKQGAMLASVELRAV